MKSGLIKNFYYLVKSSVTALVRNPCLCIFSFLQILLGIFILTFTCLVLGSFWLSPYIQRILQGAAGPMASYLWKELYLTRTGIHLGTGFNLDSSFQIITSILTQAVSVYLSALITFFLIVSFFSSAIDLFHHRQASVKKSFKRAWESKSKILFWSLITTIVSMMPFLLQIIMVTTLQITGFLAKMFFVVSLIKLVFLITSTFLFPILIYENVPLQRAWKRSLELFAQCWKELLILNIIVAAWGSFPTLCTFFPESRMLSLSYLFDLWDYTNLPIPGAIANVWGSTFSNIIVCVLYIKCIEGVFPEIPKENQNTTELNALWGKPIFLNSKHQWLLTLLISFLFIASYSILISHFESLHRTF